MPQDFDVVVVVDGVVEPDVYRVRVERGGKVALRPDLHGIDAGVVPLFLAAVWVGLVPEVGDDAVAGVVGGGFAFERFSDAAVGFDDVELIAGDPDLGAGDRPER